MSFSGYTLTEREERLLAACVGRVFRQVVWDLNAVYLVLADGSALKIEIVADAPPKDVRGDDYDEVVFTRVERLVRLPRFDRGGEAGHWYKVLATDSPIVALEIARTAVRYPAGTTSHPASVIEGERHVLADAGVLVTLETGILPAVALFNSFGFAAWPEARLYSRAEADEHCKGKYSLRSL